MKDRRVWGEDLGEILGVIGGMGPIATVDFLRHFYSFSTVAEERDYSRVFADINPLIPSRTRHILFQGIDFVPEVLLSARRLQNLGATFIALPCNSAQYKLEEIKKFVEIPVLSIFNSVKWELPKSTKRVLVLGGPVTFTKDTYKVPLEEAGRDYIKPSRSLQAQVEDVIYSVKKSTLRADQIASLRHGIIQEVKGSHIDCLVLACTELNRSLVAMQSDIFIIDSNEAYAKASVMFSQGRHDVS